MQSKRPIFLQAKWEHLAMFNYEVDEEVLHPYLPAYTVLDTFNGRALVSVVGFMFNDTRMLGVRWPWHTSFEEVNLRFYVKHFDGTTWKRGVVFISEIVPSPAIAIVANTLYHEHYAARRMKHEIELVQDEWHINYQWRNKGRWNNMNVTADASLTDLTKGSEAEFIFEHYWGYNKYNQSTTIEYGVEHISWQVHHINTASLDLDAATLYGPAFVPYLAKEPSSIFLAKGSEVIVRKPVFLRSGKLAN